MHAMHRTISTLLLTFLLALPMVAEAANYNGPVPQGPKWQQLRDFLAGRASHPGKVPQGPKWGQLRTFVQQEQNRRAEAERQRQQQQQQQVNAANQRAREAEQRAAEAERQRQLAEQRAQQQQPAVARNVSLNQAAFAGGSSYRYGHNSLANIAVRGAPADTDWNRWAMLHDGRYFRLYAFRRGSNSTIYQFAFNPNSNAYEYGYQSIRAINITGAPSDTDFSNFMMLHDGSTFRLYMRQRNARALYQFAFDNRTSTYKYGHNSIPRIAISGFPGDADYSRMQMLHDGSKFRLYIFRSGSANQFYQGAFNNSTNRYDYGHSSIAQMNVSGMPSNSNTRSAAMVHDGSAFRFYFLTR